MVRVETDVQEAFQAACTASGVKQAAILRDLIVAATIYMQTNGHWRKPMLVADTRAAEDAVQRLLAPIAGTAGAERLLMEIVDRVVEKRMISAEAREKYGTEAGAAPAQRQPIMPPVAPTARTPVRNSGAVRVEHNKRVTP